MVTMVSWTPSGRSEAETADIYVEFNTLCNLQFKKFKRIRYETLFSGIVNTGTSLSPASLQFALTF